MCMRSDLQATAALVLKLTSHDRHSANPPLESHTFKFTANRSDNFFREHGKVVETCQTRLVLEFLSSLPVFDIVKQLSGMDKLFERCHSKTHLPLQAI